MSEKRPLPRTEHRCPKVQPRGALVSRGGLVLKDETCSCSMGTRTVPPLTRPSQITLLKLIRKADHTLWVAPHHPHPLARPSRVGEMGLGSDTPGAVSSRASAQVARTVRLSAGCVRLRQSARPGSVPSRAVCDVETRRRGHVEADRNEPTGATPSVRDSPGLNSPLGRWRGWESFWARGREVGEDRCNRMKRNNV